jgi:DNA-binding winged helix-turn-helix (wHTH) protein
VRCYRFDRFSLDCSQRRLSDGGTPLELNSRYFDALALLVAECGKLISKDRFMTEVWAGIPVTDEALTQCIRTLRRQLGDDAASPRFIETVPKHGYRFIAPVDEVDGDAVPQAPGSSRSTQHWPWILVASGTLGGGLAGAIGGLFYGFAGASAPAEPGVGATSVLLVLLCLTTAVALLGAAGVSAGIVLGWRRIGDTAVGTIGGGAVGGMILGAVVKLLGMDAFRLLLGHSPGQMTGAFEGFVLGGAIGLGTWIAEHQRQLRFGTIFATLIGATAGLLIAFVGGHLMAGSLASLAANFPGSELRLDGIGALFGESGFGPVSEAVTAALEGALFSGCVVAALLEAKRRAAGIPRA